MVLLSAYLRGSLSGQPLALLLTLFGAPVLVHLHVAPAALLVLLWIVFNALFLSNCDLVSAIGSQLLDPFGIVGLDSNFVDNAGIHKSEVGLKFHDMSLRFTFVSPLT